MTGASLLVAWIGLSRLEIMAKFMATRVSVTLQESNGRVRAEAF